MIDKKQPAPASEQYIPKYKCPVCGGYPMDFTSPRLRNATCVFLPGEKPSDINISCICCGAKLGVQMKPLEHYRIKDIRSAVT